jgi:hypothetical protein
MGESRFTCDDEPVRFRGCGNGVFVTPNEVRDLLFFATPRKQQIPRANTALRNYTLGVFSEAT